MFLDGRSDAAIVGCHLTDEHGSDHRVLVTYVRSGQISVALFEPEDETVHFTVRFQIGDLITDPLESGERLTHLHSIVLAYQIGKRCGHDGFASNGFFRHGPLFDASGTDVVQKQNAHFISADELIGPVRTLHGDTHAIRIRIRCQHKIRSHFLGKFQTFLQCGKDLRVGIGTGGEITIGIFLFGHDGDIRNADILQNLRYRDKARSVQR